MTTNHLKLYHSTSSPNSRRVRMFLAEKGQTVPLAPLDLAKGVHRHHDVTLDRRPKTSSAVSRRPRRKVLKQQAIRSENRLGRVGQDCTPIPGHFCAPIDTVSTL